MSFLGKILIVAQVVLSLLFMCAAGAVFNMHVNWRDRAEKAESKATDLQTAHNNDLANLNQKIDALTQQAQNDKGRADAEVGKRQQLEQDVANLTQETNSLNQQLQRQTGLAETKTNEADYRQQEAEQQRVQNETLSDSLDVVIKKSVGLEDQLATLQQSHTELTTQYEATLKELGDLRKLARANNLPTDLQAVASMSEPPPKVAGVVRDIRKDEANRTKFVHISIGSDDGLRVGHVLDVYRTAELNNGRAKYLGRIRIWSVTPDNAVGIVVEAAKNGIIEVGDNVTTEL
jgi:myosin heavy subunit